MLEHATDYFLDCKSVVSNGIFLLKLATGYSLAC